MVGTLFLQPLLIAPYLSISATRNFALRALLLSSKSSSVAVIGLRLTRFNLGVYASGITGNPLGTSGPFHILGTPVYINDLLKNGK